ncbi:MAG: hypothetical protein NVSMB55_27830 [Mycobacteriales bacterium]
MSGLLLGAATPAGAAPSVQQVLVFTGRGHGHGVGLAQDSADAMAAAGASGEQILAHFYPGTGRGADSGNVRVDIWEGGPATAVAVGLPQGGHVSGSDRSLTVSPGTALQLSVDASGYHARVASSAHGAVLRRGLAAVASPSPAPSLLPLPMPSSAPSQPPTTAPATRPTGSAAPSRAPHGSATPTSAASPGAKPTRHPAPSASASTAASLDSTGPITLTPNSGGVTSVGPTGRSYRGTVTGLSRSGFRLVNTVDVETYLAGLGEVPADWPAAALQAQAVAARTYALRARGSAPLGYDLCDDDRCQVYLGAQRETPSSQSAASTTRGTVVTYAGQLADTFYSANAGGVTASTAEGFASAPVPYLPAGVPAAGPVAAWTVSLDPAAVAARLGYPGRLSGVVVTGRGSSGRVTSLRLDGSAGARQLSGLSLAGALGLWSTLFSVSGQRGVAQALPAPALALAQLPPEQAALAPPLPVLADAGQPGSSASPGPLSATRTAHQQKLSTAGALAVGGLVAALALALGIRSRRARLATPPPTG